MHSSDTLFAVSRDVAVHGVFVKLASPVVIELLGTTSLDFAVLDAEHAPLDLAAIDLLLMAGRAAGLPLLVRVADASPARIQSALDMGAAGVVVPRVESAAHATDIVASAKFKRGSRGFSSSPRYAGYGTMKRATVLARGDATLVVCQIESAGALEQVEAIAAVQGVDALFIGRADLALSMEIEDTADERMVRAVGRICRAARDAGKVCGIHVSDGDEARKFSLQDASFFVIASDQGLLQRAVQHIARHQVDSQSASKRDRETS